MALLVMVMLLSVCIFIPLVVSMFGAADAVSVPSATDIRNLAGAALEDTGTHVYVMLGNNPARERNIHQLLDNMGLDEAAIEKYVTIVPAITVTEMKDLKLRREFISSTNGLVTEEYVEKALFYSAFQLCCFLTHIKTWLLFQNSPQYKNALIFEDDANIADTNELQLLHKFNGSSSYPTANSRLFRHLNDREKQLILLDKMLRLSPALWDVQYLGFCYDCGNVRRHPILAAKTFYLHNGIDAFLPNVPSSASAGGAETGTGSFNPGDSLTEQEEEELARRYFYYGHTKPLCLHSYVLNRRLTARLLRLQGGLRYWDPPHWASDAYLPDVFCRFKMKMLRSIIPIFNQNGNGGDVSYLKHSYNKPAESKHSCEEAIKQCHKLHVNQTEMDKLGV